MGKTQRKTSKYLELYSKTFKRKAQSVLSFTPPGASRLEYFSLFAEVFPDDIVSMQRHYDFYSEKNTRRRHGKPVFFPNPEQLLFDLVRHRLSRISRDEWDPSVAELRKTEAQNLSALERKRRLKKYKLRNISTQNVLPKYLSQMMTKYWKETQKIIRLHVVREVGKYKSAQTLFFLRQVLSGEDDWFIKNTAFRIIQRLDEFAYLPSKGKGNRDKYDTLVNRFGCEFTDDLGRGAIDIMKGYEEKNFVEMGKDFDVFISHHVTDSGIVDNVVSHLNTLGLVAFVDWKSDRHDLIRQETAVAFFRARALAAISGENFTTQRFSVA